ncbi:MAG TPA: IS66 family transposase [Gemmataceae bacterium]|nr:IS66 family transposase [Gemmataceae bacterium]
MKTPEAELARLRAHNHALEEEKARLLSLNEGLEAQLKETLLELAELKRQLFGEKSEKLTPEEEGQLAEVSADLQEQLQRDPPASDDVLEDQSQEQPKDPPKRRTPRRRHPLPEHLERQTLVLEPAGLNPCPDCGQAPERIGEETSEELDYVPAKVVVRRTVRPKYACRCGGAGVHIAPLPPRLLPQSKLGLGMAVHLLLGRFDDHVAYYTLERIFLERHAVVIPRQQMVQWVAHIAFLLQPLCRLMFEHMKQGGYLQVDETPVKVMDPEVKGKCARGYLWFYAVPGGDVFLDFQDTRGRDAPHAQLADFFGTIQTDAYEVYDSLKKVIGDLVRIGCAAHSRRKFHRAIKDGDRRAIWFIAQFRQLYRIEREAKSLTPENRHQIRQQQAAQIWVGLHAHAQALQPELLPKSSLGKAVSYFLNEYDALTGYLKSGTYEIDNNLVENSIRVPAVGRRRWLFIGHPDAGWRSAVIYSLIVSCRRRGINPQEYLTDVLQRLPSMNITQIAQLLPEHWKPAAKAS